MKYISINGGTIRRNAVTGSTDAPIRIAKTKGDAKPEYASEIEILDVWGNVAAKLVYDPKQKILRCGARLVLECKHGVRVTR